MATDEVAAAATDSPTGSWREQAVARSLDSARLPRRTGSNASSMRPSTS